MRMMNFSIHPLDHSKTGLRFWAVWYITLITIKIRQLQFMWGCHSFSGGEGHKFSSCMSPQLGPNTMWTGSGGNLGPPSSKKCKFSMHSFISFAAECSTCASTSQRSSSWICAQSFAPKPFMSSDAVQRSIASFTTSAADPWITELTACLSAFARSDESLEAMCGSNRLRPPIVHT